ncbi:MAG TPA: DUF4192 domain-containing protein [Mycobacteriales bacterium]|jgi:hypothetical protein|nr:DUF4192 domain-containing protein [Mycobacteriales bacterium]
MTVPAPVLTCRDPGDLAALVPRLVGFAPSESLVVLSLRGPRRRIGLTVRADLADVPLLIRQIGEGLVRDGARAAVLVVHSHEPGVDGHPWSELVSEVEQALAGRGIEVTEALLVRGGRWWSYSCTAPCCPPTGRPVDTGSALVTAAASEQAYDGRAVLASREELVASVAPQPPLGAALARRLQAQARQALEGRRPAGRRGDAELDRWRRALDSWESRPAPLPPADAAALALALHVVEVRDAVLSWSGPRRDALLGLLGQLSRGVVPPDDAPLCAVLAGVAYAHGNGALALVAVQRALSTDPGYGLAQLLLAALDGLLPPAQVRAALAAGPDGAG